MNLSAPTCVLVTGGAGYIGSHAALELLRRGHRVIIVDTLERGPRETIDRLDHEGDLTFVQGDCGDASLVGPLLDDVDSVMHFAAYAWIEESMEFPDRYLQNNVEVTRSLLTATLEAGVQRFILSSTCAVYGSPPSEHLPVTEDSPLDPQNPYGDSKVQAEALLPRAIKGSPLAAGVLRYFNVIGTDANGVLPEPVVEARLLSSCLQVARGQRDHFTINGTDYDTNDGTAVRDFVHVTDIALAHLALMVNLQSSTLRTYNVGCGHGTSVREIIRAVEKVSGQTLPTTEGPRRPGDIAAIWADTARIQKELHWSPEYGDIDAMIATSWQAD